MKWLMRNARERRQCGHGVRGVTKVNRFDDGASAALFCWIFFYFSFAGAGPWSLDALIASSRTASGREKAAS
jgi:hypothetical protein